MSVKSTVSAAALASLVAVLSAFGGVERIGFDYTISRPGVEKKAGSLNDGQEKTGVNWHTKGRASTLIVLELKERREIDRLEVSAPKWTKWYILDELRVSADPGTGVFGDPIVVPGMPRTCNSPVLKDASCTNHVFRVAGIGPAVRIQVDVRSDAAVSINEIRLFARAKPPAEHTKPVAKTAAKESERRNLRKMENAQWRLAFDPIGGRAARLYSKAIGAELTDLEGKGSFVEEVWDRPKSHFFLAGKPYAMQYAEEPGGRLTVTGVANAQGGGIDFLKVEKRYAASDDSTALGVDYRFTNLPEAMALQNYAPLIHATLGVFGDQVTCYYPMTDGIAAVRPGNRGNQFWGHRPARGWMAAATEDGRGVAVTMPYADVKSFYSWFSQVPTLEWRMIPVGLKESDCYDVSTELIPFSGLPVVSGAGGGLVGMLSDGVCRVVSARAGEVTAEAGGQTERLHFAKPGDAATFKTTARTVVLKREGRIVCSLDAAPSEGEWTLPKAGPQRESSVAEVDLTCYTNFPKRVCTAWGKPLAGRRLRVAAVTGCGNLIEVGRLAERLDMEYRTIGVSVSAGPAGKRTLGNPIFSNGDHFSLINTSDAERGIAKVLSWEADVILMGGVPYEVLDADLRKLLLAQVKKGTGLVWIGLDRNVPELGFRLKDVRVRKLAPDHASGFFSSVPFAALGEEDLSVVDASSANMHVRAGNVPYIFETTCGKGRVFHLAYRALSGGNWPAAGLTPAGLRDFYETRTAPVETYLSLIAKTLQAAAGRTMPLAFGETSVSASQAHFAVTSGGSCRTRWSWRACDSFGRVLAQGEKRVSLAGGDESVVLENLSVPPTAGTLVLEAVVRAETDGHVLNWGGWAFASPPVAELTALATDAAWRSEGDDVSVVAKVTGDCAGVSLVLSLIDSYGRTIAERRQPAAHDVRQSLTIANALPARCYAVEGRLLDAGGTELSRRRVEVRVRPDPSKDPWDDFEAGTWANAANREYLWPELAATYRDMGVSTVIANPHRMQTDFPMRHGFHPTVLNDAGLHRSPEPKAYSQTGDKLKLVRGTCLSSPKFFSGRDKANRALAETLARSGSRFVWFGDEQSITGYNGAAVDFCFSPDCLREMRAFLQGKYGDLASLNKAWETAFAAWDEVVPMTRQEVWEAGGRHVAGWSDHLEFMDNRLTNSLAYSVRALHEADPAVRFSLSGTQQPSAYGGMDWWKILHVLDSALNYGTGGQFDIHRSFCPQGGFMPWNWGYGSRGASAVDRVWEPAFVGARGIMGFQSSSQLNADWTYSQGLRDTLPHIRRLTGGVGRHFIANLTPPREVAILYSQASYRAAFIENRREEHDQVEEQVRRVLLHLGFAYDYVSYEQLAAGKAVARGYKALVLADAAAMSDAEVRGVLAFAARGGLVIAEGVPAVRRDNCVCRADSPLKAHFEGSTRHVLFDRTDVDYLKASEFPDKAEHAPAVAAVQKKWRQALLRAGCSDGRIVLTDAESGRPVRNATVRPKTDRAGHPTWCIRAAASSRVRDVRFAFPKEGFVYDLVSGRAYGRVRELKLPFGAGVPYAFAQYPAEVALQAPQASGATVRLAYSVPVDGVVRVRVYRPDGSEAWCYAKNVTLKDGRSAYEIPFSLSDPSGTWRIEAVSVFDGKTQKTEVIR